MRSRQASGLGPESGIDEALLEMFIVYERPRDFPGHYVLRRWVVQRGGSRPTDDFVLEPTLEKIREHVPPHCVRLERDPNDEAHIVETWL